MQGWDQTEEEHEETAMEGVVKGEKRRDDNPEWTERVGALIQLSCSPLRAAVPQTHTVI